MIEIQASNDYRLQFDGWNIVVVDDQTGLNGHVTLVEHEAGAIATELFTGMAAARALCGTTPETRCAPGCCQEGKS